jgi:hypothetical protein
MTLLVALGEASRVRCAGVLDVTGLDELIQPLAYVAA